MPDASVELATETGDHERYLVHSRLEITSILRSLIDRGALVTVCFGDRGEFIVTSLLAINPDFEELIFDCGAVEAQNARLLAASNLTLVSQLDHIRVQFLAARAEATTFEQAPALRIRLPDVLTRLQRRENYRVRVPLRQHLLCRMQLDPEDAERAVQTRICDVSGGGVALVDFPPSLELLPGTVYRDCRIDLGDIGEVTTDIEIVHVLEKVNRNAVRTRLCGCRFRNLSSGMLMRIQRYINRLEREQKARS